MSCSTAALPFTSRHPAAKIRNMRRTEEYCLSAATAADLHSRCYEPVTSPAAARSPVAPRRSSTPAARRLQQQQQPPPPPPTLFTSSERNDRTREWLRLLSLTASTLGLRLIWAGGKSKPTPSCLITALNRHRFSGNSALLAAK